MSRAIVFAAELRKIMAGAGTRPGIRWGDSGDREQLLCVGADERWLDQEMSNDSMFVVAENEGKVVGYSCYPTRESMSQLSWLLVRVRLGLDVFSVGGFVVPEWRGQRIRGDMKRFAARHFFEQGYQRMISVVDAQNTASIRSNANVGAVPLMTLMRVRLGKLTLVWQGRALRHARWGTQPFILSV